jgi:hypothetical protein
MIGVDKPRLNQNLIKKLKRVMSGSEFGTPMKYLMRDLKKEGLTKPRQLLKVMIEAINEVFPDSPLVGLETFYDKVLVQIGDSVEELSRGHGLGMANSLTTLMQIVIWEMVVTEVTNHYPDVEYEADVLFYNDDFIASFGNQESFELSWDSDTLILESLSLIKANDKSIVSESFGVLCEEYRREGNFYEDFGLKDYFQLRESLLIFTCINIVHAKEYYNSLPFWSTRIEDCFQILLDFFGHEFNPEESSWPFEFGGWTSRHIGLINMGSYDMFKENPQFYTQTFSLKEAKPRVKTKHKDKTIVCLNPYVVIAPLPLLDDYEGRDLALGFMPKNKAELKMLRYSLRPGKLTMKYRSLQDSRRRLFSHYDCSLQEAVQRFHSMDDLGFFFPPLFKIGKEFENFKETRSSLKTYSRMFGIRQKLAQIGFDQDSVDHSVLSLLMEGKTEKVPKRIDPFEEGFILFDIDTDTRGMFPCDKDVIFGTLLQQDMALAAYIEVGRKILPHDATCCKYFKYMAEIFGALVSPLDLAIIGNNNLKSEDSRFVCKNISRRVSLTQVLEDYDTTSPDTEENVMQGELEFIYQSQNNLIDEIITRRVTARSTLFNESPEMTQSMDALMHSLGCLQEIVEGYRDMVNYNDEQEPEIVMREPPLFPGLREAANAKWGPDWWMLPFNKSSNQEIKRFLAEFLGKSVETCIMEVRAELEGPESSGEAPGDFDIFDDMG